MWCKDFNFDSALDSLVMEFIHRISDIVLIKCRQVVFGHLSSFQKSGRCILEDLKSMLSILFVIVLRYFFFKGRFSFSRCLNESCVSNEENEYY